MAQDKRQSYPESIVYTMKYVLEHNNGTQKQQQKMISIKKGERERG